jgi:hypothetical protein
MSGWTGLNIRHNVLQLWTEGTYSMTMSKAKDKLSKSSAK